MADESKQQPLGRITLATPTVRLKKPRLTGYSLKVAGAVVTAVAVLLWLLREGEPRRSNIESSSALGPSTVDEVVEMTKQMTKSAAEPAPKSSPEPAINSAPGSSALPTVKPASSRSDAGGFPRVLNGVPFHLTIPQGWTTDVQDQQIFVRRGGDPRVCQITAKSGFDSASFIAEVRGHEVETETNLIEGLLTAAGGGRSVVNATGQLLASTVPANAIRYAVKVRVVTSVGARSSVMGGVSAMAVAGDRMVRLQCMNTASDSDQADEMAIMGRSLSTR